MKKQLQKLTLNRETITLLSRSQLNLAHGGGASGTAVGSECLTDGCSRNYCFTHLDTCIPCRI